MQSYGNLYAPMLDKNFIESCCYEAAKGKRNRRSVKHYAKRYIGKWIHGYGNKRFYILKTDIHHFFGNIDRSILKEKIRAKIRSVNIRQLKKVVAKHIKGETENGNRMESSQIGHKTGADRHNNVTVMHISAQRH